MGLVVADLWVGGTNKSTEYGLGPLIAVRRKLVETLGWALLTGGSGQQIKTLASGRVLGLQ